MKTEALNIQYQGFHPSDFIQEYTVSVMRQILLESPHNAILKASISKFGDHFKANVTVNSSRGPFFSSAVATSLKDVVDDAQMQLRRHLEKWRAKRKKRSHEKITTDSDLDFTFI